MAGSQMGQGSGSQQGQMKAEGGDSRRVRWQLLGVLGQERGWQGARLDRGSEARRARW